MPDGTIEPRRRRPSIIVNGQPREDPNPVLDYEAYQSLLHFMTTSLEDLREEATRTTDEQRLARLAGRRDAYRNAIRHLQMGVRQTRRRAQQGG